jgi:CBS domain-containing protein
MRATDLQTPLPVIGRSTTALEAARLIAADRLPGLVVGDADGKPVAVVSTVDVLALLVPSYVLDDLSLAGVFDERGSEEMWQNARERTIAELLDDDGVRLRDILMVDDDATIVEIAAQMADSRSQIALVRNSPPGAPQFIELPTLMNAILGFSGPAA